MPQIFDQRNCEIYIWGTCEKCLGTIDIGNAITVMRVHRKWS